MSAVRPVQRQLQTHAAWLPWRSSALFFAIHLRTPRHRLQTGAGLPAAGPTCACRRPDKGHERRTGERSREHSFNLRPSAHSAGHRRAEITEQSEHFRLSRNGDSRDRIGDRLKADHGSRPDQALTVGEANRQHTPDTGRCDAVHAVRVTVHGRSGSRFVCVCTLPA